MSRFPEYLLKLWVVFVSLFHDRDIHFWLGNDTTHDEKGVAAYKTVRKIELK